jgi:aspartate kinase
MKVLKFGGTSVGTAQRIQNLAQIIPGSGPVVVVLSAMAGTTNALIEITDTATTGNFDKAMELTLNHESKYLKTSDELFSTEMYKKRGEEFVKDMFGTIKRKLNDNFSASDAKEVVAVGELLSTGLFHMYLVEMGRRSAYLPALSYMRIDKDKEPDYFYIGENLNRLIKENQGAQVYVTQGFICRDVDGRIDNLGRGGSDYTAAIIGNVIYADEVQIWTDIDGLHNNDPRYVEGTSPIRELSFDEAAELAYFGAKILHPSTILPCSRRNIPVILKNTLQPADPGTVITGEYNPSGIKALAAKDGITAIKIRSSRMLMAHGFLKRVFEIFDQFKTPVDMITTSEVAVSLTIDNSSNLNQIVSELRQFSTVEVDPNQTIICIVGDFVAEKPGYADRVLSTIRHIPIRMISYGGSSHNISVLIDSRHKVEALRALHQVVSSNSFVTVQPC